MIFLALILTASIPNMLLVCAPYDPVFGTVLRRLIAVRNLLKDSSVATGDS